MRKVQMSVACTDENDNSTMFMCEFELSDDNFEKKDIAQLPPD